MEEDIKILEELKKHFYDDYDFMKDEIIIWLDIADMTAIENLIKRVKELEQKLEEKDMQHELELIGKEEYTKTAMGEIIEKYYTANEDCIPKSKIKEKIDYLVRQLICGQDIPGLGIELLGYEGAIEILQELLKE